MLKSIVTGLAAAVLFTTANSDWVPQKLKDNIKVNMPAGPKTILLGDIKEIRFTWDDSAVVGGLVNDYSKFGIPEENMPELMKQARKGFEDNLIKNKSVILSETESVYKNFSCFEFISSKKQDGVDVKRSDKFISNKTSMVNLYYAQGRNGYDENIKKKFYNSLDFN